VIADAARGFDVQPLVDSQARIGVVADCRLDNRETLRSELALDGDVSDSGLILKAYRRWGNDLCQHLRGDFAGVIWDWGRNLCLAFKDPLGVKPLFYTRHSGGITVGSDAEIILKLVRPDPTPDDHAVVEYLLWEFASPDRTFFAAISRLPGGHFIADGPSQTGQIQRYWTPPTRSRRFGGIGEAFEEFRHLFFRSVERRLDSTGPVLAHLSGGLDSSLIVCVANEIIHRQGGEFSRFGTVSERFPGTAWDEGDFIQAVRDGTGVEGTEWDGSNADFLDLASPSLSGPGTRVYRTSGSTGDTDLAVEEGARVLLSGAGGDQLGAPSGVTDDGVKSQRMAFAIETLTRLDLSAAQRAARARRLARPCFPANVRKTFAAFKYRRRMPEWLQPRWRSLAGDIVSTFYPTLLERSFEHNVQRAHWHELTSARTGTALDLHQRVAGRTGVEFRFPFLDQELVEMVLSMPPGYWPAESPGSRLHRTVMGDLLPPRIRERRTKAIFSGAVGQRLKREAPQIDALFHKGDWFSSRYVLRHEAQQLLSRVPAASESHEPWRTWHEVRAIATLETWLRRVFGYAAGRSEVSDG
jgi:asparagine synthase (glutamine-hydrolysing)